jgi:hypothetical protein
VHQFNWTPGIGDPTVAGWVTVVLYFAAALSCAIAARRLANAPVGNRNETLAWATIAAAFVALGINKQLDLQTALTELGRVVIMNSEYRELKSVVQLSFIAFVAVVCIVSGLTLYGLMRRTSSATSLALMGTTFILGFVFIRAASFHHIDRFISARFLLLKWNWIVEMGGINVVLVASLWRRALIPLQATNS